MEDTNKPRKYRWDALGKTSHEVEALINEVLGNGWTYAEAEKGAAIHVTVPADDPSTLPPGLEPMETAKA